MGSEGQDESGELSSMGVTRRRNKVETVKEMNAVRSPLGSPRKAVLELWGSVKHQLVEFSALPAHLRDNNYILGHYRVDWSVKRALFSIFEMHNETFNVWTYVLFPSILPLLNAGFELRLAWQSAMLNLHEVSEIF